MILIWLNAIMGHLDELARVVRPKITQPTFLTHYPVGDDCSCKKK